MPDKENIFHRFVNQNDPTRDVKLAAFGLVVLFAIVKLAFHQITDQWVNAFYGLCALVGLGGAAMLAVEKFRGGNGAQQTASPTGEEDKENRP